MPGAQLSWPLVRGLLDDCKEVGIRSIRLYGGEPLLHKDLTRIVEHSVRLGLNTWMTTNGILLRDRIDDLYKAALRSISVGYYGTGEEYDEYVQRKSKYTHLEEGVAYVHELFVRSVGVALDCVLVRPNCSIDAGRMAWECAERYCVPVGGSLI